MNGRKDRHIYIVTTRKEGENTRTSGHISQNLHWKLLILECFEEEWRELFEKEN